MSTYKNYLEILEKFIQFKSISTSSEFKAEMKKTAEFLSDLFNKHNFKVEVIEGFGNPIVLAEFNIEEKDAESCLIYGHYDVQPADKSDGWESDPFELVERDGRLYARGAIDNKGQVLVHIATIFDLIKSGELRYNIKFMLEGDEETGSPDLPGFVEKYKDKLTCDFVMLSDGTLYGKNPILEAGFRGGINATVMIKTAEMDMHSGMYGGAVPSASHEAAEFVAKLFNAENEIAIPGFYDDVDEIPEEIRKNNESIPFDIAELTKLTGTKELKKEKEFDYFSATALRPTIQVSGIQSGYVGEGYRNSIPAVATVKLNFRLVKSQDPEDIVEKLKQFISATLPSYASWDLEINDPYVGVKVDLDNDYVRDAKEKLEKAFDNEAFYLFSGGGLPIVTLFNDILGVPQVLAPFANEDSNMHAINENYDTRVLKKGLEFSRSFFGEEY